MEIMEEEIINQMENIIIIMNDIKELVVLIFGFLVGYIIVKDFIRDILKSV